MIGTYHAQHICSLCAFFLFYFIYKYSFRKSDGSSQKRNPLTIYLNNVALRGDLCHDFVAFRFLETQITCYDWSRQDQRALLIRPRVGNCLAFNICSIILISSSFISLLPAVLQLHVFCRHNLFFLSFVMTYTSWCHFYLQK